MRRMLMCAMLAGVVSFVGCSGNDDAGSKANENAGSVKQEEEVEEIPANVEFPDSVELPGNVKLELIRVNEGKFLMDDEREKQKVTLTRPYMIGKYEVTQKQYVAVMGTNPSHVKGDTLPVENVTWLDAMEFCKKLNALTEGKRPKGYKYSLPTEAQWEYAAHGGNQSLGYEYCGSNDVNEVAWWDENSENTVHPVGQKKPNELGLYDMSGNVWEWCLDLYGNYSTEEVTDPKGATDGDWRVCRGGSWNYIAKHCKPGTRNAYFQDKQEDFNGFRLALIPAR